MTLFICRGKNRGKTLSDVSSWTNEIDSQPSRSAADAGDSNNESGSGKTGKSESEVVVLSLRDQLKWAEQHVVRKVVISTLLELLIQLT